MEHTTPRPRATPMTASERWRAARNTSASVASLSLREPLGSPAAQSPSPPPQEPVPPPKTTRSTFDGRPDRGADAHLAQLARRLVTGIPEQCGGARSRAGHATVGSDRSTDRRGHEDGDETLRVLRLQRANRELQAHAEAAERRAADLQLEKEAQAQVLKEKALRVRELRASHDGEARARDATQAELAVLGQRCERLQHELAALQVR